MLKLSAQAAAAHAANRVGGPDQPACHAPFTSMYFDQFGNVLACCINTLQTMGSYPSQSLADIWSSERARELRDALAAGDFSLGCHDCHSSISSGNFNAVNAMFDQQVLDTPPEWVVDNPPVAEDQRDLWPRMLEFALSTRCNLTCTMCSGYFSSAIRKAEGLEPLPEVYGDEFVTELRPFLEHVTDVRFYGGEPFLAPVNFAILELLCQVNPSCKVSITTNGTIWNQRVQQIVEVLKPTIVVSIDAFTADGFESIRVGANRDKVFANLEQFSQVDGCKVSLAVCAMRQNVHEIPELVRFANLNSLHLGFNVVRYPQDHSLSSATAEELSEAIALWEALLQEQWSLDAPQLSQAGQENLRRIEGILSEARGWLLATDAQTAGLEIRSSSASAAQDRRRDWLGLLAEMAASTYNSDALLTEDAFELELTHVLAEFDQKVAPQDRARRLAMALAEFSDDSLGPAEIEAFDQFAATLATSAVTPRIRLMTGLPPALIAQGVINLDPKVLAARFDSFFPPERNHP
jgi:MoaA/NifB/PqqE/SkfB family radical SAM enzyme